MKHAIILDLVICTIKYDEGHCYQLHGFDVKFMNCMYNRPGINFWSRHISDTTFN